MNRTAVTLLRLSNKRTARGFVHPALSARCMSTTENLRGAMERDGKTQSVVSTKQFLQTAAMAAPMWAGMMVPLSAAYQVGKRIALKFVPKEQFVPSSPLDSGYEVSEGDIIPRGERKFDLVVMGSTGFVGKLAVRHLAKTYGVGKEVKWAIAGRSQSKMDEVKKTLAEELDMKEIMDVVTIVADTSLPETMPNLVRDTRTVVTSAGPYWDYGSTVVEYCAKFGTHYSDITAETGWVKTMMQKWQDTAKKTGARIVPIAGHDCIPWDLTVCTLADKLEQETGEELASVTCYDEQRGSMSGGTIATMFLLVGGASPRGPSTDPFRFTAEGKAHPHSTENKIAKSISKFEKPWDGETSFGRPFIMSPVNCEVVGWSQALRGAGPLTYSEVLVSPDFKSAFVGYIQTVSLVTGLLNPFTRERLSKALPKPGQGPSMNAMQNRSFLAVTVHGVGTKGSEIQGFMYFPRDAGYLDTARLLVESGLSMALEENEIPAKNGGFYSPGYALGDVLMDRIVNTGTTFEWKMVKSKN